MTDLDENLGADLEERIRERGVRVEERLALLRTLGDPEGEEELRGRVDDLVRRIEAAASKVRGALR